jgi:putative transposase
MMEQEASDAEKTGRARVIVQDNGPIHRCSYSSTVVDKVGKPGFVHQLYCLNIVLK